jgi:demethylmenaquinone methyltransferase/2-methoxy-6-polyprenyl-1,4-benzoquinol methylase
MPSVPDPARVRSMFTRIAGRYDLLNHALSLGIDRSWRRRVLDVAGDLHGRTAVDVCCGTGDLTAVLARAGARVIGVDFVRPMLARGAPKLRAGDGAVLFAHADALRLPLADGSCDLAAVAFGIRNVADRRAGLAEMRRVVRPGGRVVVLEFTNPPGRVMSGIYRLYFTRVLPRIGGLVSGDGEAYEYLPRTVLAWPDAGAFQLELEEVGLADCGHKLLTGGIACLHWGRA